MIRCETPWYNLGGTLPPGGKVDAIKHDPTNFAAWTGLGVIIPSGGKVDVGGLLYEKQRCLLDAIKHDPTNSAAWTGLGGTLPPGGKVDVGGLLYDRQGCFLSRAYCRGGGAQYAISFTGLLNALLEV